MTTASMSSNSQHTITDELLQDFKALLIKNFSDLEKEKVDALRLFYNDKDIPKNIYGTFNFLTALEDAGKFSWKNVRSLKRALTSIREEVLVDALEGFEIKRNVALLLDAFVRIRKGIPRQNLFENIDTIAGYLANLITECELDKRKVRSLRKSKTNIEEVMILLEELIRETNHSKPWTNRLALLTVIAGELLCETETNNKEFPEARPEDVSRCAAEICSRMTSLEEWVRPIDRRS